MALNPDRADLRAQLRRRRAQIEPALRQRAALALARCLPGAVAAISARRIGLYHAMGSEVDLAPSAQMLWALGLQLFLPRMLGRDPPEMRFLPWDDPNAVLTPDAYGIPAPFSSVGCTADALDLILVPGLGFDATGARLGSGAGCYDRALASRRLKGAPPALWGVAFSAQHLAQLPSAEWDIRMDRVIYADLCP